MKSVDYMIKYLSGDLNLEESHAFDKELLEDKELSATFSQVSKAYDLISDQIKLRDEQEFISRLRKVMDRPQPVATGDRGKRPGWILLLSLAASICILVTIILMKGSDEDIHITFFHPLEDQVVLTISQETRGEYESVAAMFTRSEFASVLEKTSLLLSLDETDNTALLFNLLASIEVDREAEALSRFDQMDPDPSHVMGQALSWYRVLALIKLDQVEEAMKVLEVLLMQPGPYKKDAHKLQKMLIK